MKRSLLIGTLLLFILIFMGAFLVYPLLFAIERAFIVDGQFSLRFFNLMLTSPKQWRVIFNSINVAFFVTLISCGIAVPLAWVMTRFHFIGQRLVGVLLLFPLLLPPFVGALGFRQIMGRFGSFNLLLMDAGIIDLPVDLLGTYKSGGVVFVQALHLFPLMYLNVAAALAGVNTALEEAAAMTGASNGKVLRTIILPALLPAIVSSGMLVFVGSFTDLGTPLLFEHREMLPVQIFGMISDINENPLGYSLIVFVALVALGAFVLPRSVMKRSRFEVGEKGARRIQVRPLNCLTGSLVLGAIGILLLISFLPHFGVVLLSLADRWFMTILPDGYTLRNFVGVFTHPLTQSALRNSLVLSAMSTILDIVLGVVLAWYLFRSRAPGKILVESMVLLPLAVPGILFAFGYIGGYSGTPLDPRINPFPLLIIAYAIRKLPYMVRACSQGFLTASRSLEEASMSVGASFFRTFFRITLPLMSQHLLAGGILCFSFAMLEVSDSIILAMEEKFFPVSKALYALTQRPDGVALACALAVILMTVIVGALWGVGKATGKDLGEFFRI